MLFNSYSFLLLYLPVVLTGFFSLIRWQWNQTARLWLLLCSLWFYGYWDVRFLPLLIGSIACNYFCGAQILHQRSSYCQKAFLCSGILGNLALLFYFKYYNFFLSLIPGRSSFADVLLPLGISFFTFTQIAYLIDAYQGKADKCDIISYGLFVTIFPHLIAGPILHHKEMIKQFHSPDLYTVSWPHIAQGCFLFVIGMAKKVLIADHLASIVQPIFDSEVSSIPFMQAWFGALSYTLQLYFDFSGYSDMAVGLGLLFNLRLPLNFNSPYQADSIIDFWRRWHITLSTFLRDYLYIPLGGSRYGKWTKMRNLFLTMLLGGLWHGAGWTFVLWGACHGFFLIVNHLWRELKLTIPTWLARTFTLLAVIVSWVIFRSPDVSTALTILSGMIGLQGVVLPESYEASLAFLKHYGVVFHQLSISKFRSYDFLLLFALGVVVLKFPNSQAWTEHFQRRPLAWAIPCALIFFTSFIQLDELAEFLYYQF
jgi:alginate O-acetyltransferase complex protein AlgI